MAHDPFHFAFPVRDLSMRLRGRPEEQATMFLLHRSGNALELKAYRDPSAVYQR